MHSSQLLLLPFAIAATVHAAVLGEGCNPHNQDEITDAWFVDTDVVANTNRHWSFSGSSGVSWHFNTTSPPPLYTYGYPDTLRSWHILFDSSKTPADGVFRASASQVSCQHDPIYYPSEYLIVGGVEGDLPRGAKVGISIDGHPTTFSSYTEDAVHDWMTFCADQRTLTPPASTCDGPMRWAFKTPDGKNIFGYQIDGQVIGQVKGDDYNKGRYVMYTINVEFAPQNVTHVPDVVIAGPWSTFGW